MLDFPAYLERVGLSAGERPTLQTIHRAHATSIPFENLDPHRGIPVSLAQEDLERKLVHEQRGGYCFEQNLLLASALEHLGLTVEPMLARVRRGAPPGTVRPRSHLVLRVTDDSDRVWHADVGLGLGTLLDPIPFGPDGGGAYEQFGWSFRVIEEGFELVLQTLVDGSWSDVYAFSPQPVPRIDIEISNWWTSTNPQSPFVFGLIATVNHPDGSRESLSDWSGQLELKVQSPGYTQVSQPPRQAISKLLAERFALPGFALGADGRVQ
ncbi:MAG TPA: arylamine N-acetyltransferase [Solirubrobacteraceae bacterium]|jgi:N-hydroxyarylamine O-acetyltransferase|nr:arylamine N-acetyltransferase [Solirubrobacteraceae bacterium]